MQFAALRTDRLSSASVTVGEVRDRLKSSVRSISVINFVSHYKNLKPDRDHLEKIRTWEFVKRKLSNVLNNWWDTVQGCNFNNESAHFWIFWHQTSSSVLDSLSQLSQLSVVLCKCSDVVCWSTWDLFIHYHPQWNFTGISKFLVPWLRENSSSAQRVCCKTEPADRNRTKASTSEQKTKPANFSI